MSLKVLAERAWLAATDTAPSEMIDGADPEELYKLGFLNALQATLLGSGADGEERSLLAHALTEAAELMEDSDA